MEVTKEQRDELRREWVVALRSGEYRQGDGTLHSLTRGWCCLGVACDVFDKKFPGVLCREPCYEREKFDGVSAALPSRVMDDFGISTTLGDCDGSPNLATRNDSGESFSQIADIIESRPPGLFVDDKELVGAPPLRDAGAKE